MSKPFSSFYDYLLPELPGCSTAFLDLHLCQVAREFCDKTSAWAEAFPTITAAADTLTYFFVTAAPRSELVRITQLRVNDVLQWRATEPREPASTEQIEKPRFPAHRAPFTLDAAREQITLIEQPEGDIELVGSMRPTMTASSLPDVLFDQHLEAIRFGVLSRLMLMPRKKWTDRDLGLDYQHKFNARINLHATEAATGNTRAPLRTRTTPI